jgi:hypothetical protein
MPEQNLESQVVLPRTDLVIVLGLPDASLTSDSQLPTDNSPLTLSAKAPDDIQSASCRNDTISHPK